MTYSIGIDYGTASGRVFLVDTTNGEIISTYIKEYPHGTISESLNGTELPHNYFLQHAADYTSILEEGVQYVLKDSQVDPKSIIGIGM